jgi:hypothetical protein
MLQAEMVKGRKKINETRKKTREIKELQRLNDVKYFNKLHTSQVEETKLRGKYEERMKTANDIKEKKFRIFTEKQREVEQYKQEKRRNK